MSRTPPTWGCRRRAHSQPSRCKNKTLNKFRIDSNLQRQTSTHQEECVEGDLWVGEHAGEEDEHLEVPDLERQHHRRRGGEPGERGEVVERRPGEARPRRGAPGAPHDVRELPRDEHPPRGAERQGGPREAQAEHPHRRPAERQVEREARRQHGGAGRHDALRLEELLDGEVGGVGEDLRDEAAGEPGGGAGDLRRLAEQEEDALRARVQRRQRDAGRRQQHRRPLQVHPEHLVPPGAVRLPAQRLHRAAHPELDDDDDDTWMPLLPREEAASWTLPS
ncbi:Os07g0516650 [Oryza sativa Japonica Group]|uniref:Os07g0516650 protein n=1 Tax=Oryza sativa subsp. japonica TaxID=39947 RepID=A0A0P0X712_ORYSJ|nr:hypothetical protein EE612_039578 [Oryza sativa]BAT01767.1 Os07g0516650 [Oryza sativa Japonica Group]